VPILKGDVKLVASEVMSDDPEGGGPPTARVIVDGASNALFPDISEVDRAAGRVNARKVHVVVQSTDTASYLGPNVIIGEPPNDPNVSITLFATGDAFDRRTDAISRVESYLTRGAAYEGFLYGDQVEGQQVIMIVQRTGDVPTIGRTLALTKRQGYPNEAVQYVRVTAARATLRTYSDANGDFQRYIVEVRLSDPLRMDFKGFPTSRFDPAPDALNLATRISETVVADAAKYYGVSPLKVGAALGDFTVRAKSIFSQLVPSAQIETPIGDARTNQLLAGLVATGAPITRTFTTVFSPAQSIYVGGGIKPGTLSVTSGGVRLEDSGGTLQAAGVQVGTVDYENGILSLLSPVFGTVGVLLAVDYQPAQAVQAVTQSQGFKVTQSTRSTSQVVTIEPPPVPGTLSIAYRYAAQWYVLRDQGDGKLRGLDSGYGAGSVNFETGTVISSFGALPDVGTEIIYQWVEPVGAAQSDALELENDGYLYWPINVDGVVTEEPGTRAIVPGQIAILWLDNGVQRTATDDMQGRLQGDATGTVNYARGTMRVSPKVLPPMGTTFTVSTDTSAYASFKDRPLVNGAGNFGFTAIREHSIDFAVAPVVTLRYDGGAFVPGPPAFPRRIYDKGGKLYMSIRPEGYRYDDDLQVGTVNYTTGDFQLFPNVDLGVGAPALLGFMKFNNFYYSEIKAFNQVRALASA
jgi:hypothetical protein